MIKVIILLGPAGSGKGTQAQKLIEKHQLQKIETGEIVRKIAQEDSDLGRKFKQIHESGAHVADDLMKKLVIAELKRLDLNKGILFDGYPRTLTQAKDLDEILMQFSLLKKKIALWIDVSPEEAKRRLLNRAICKSCGQILLSRKVKKCPQCGAQVEIRDYDQSEQAIDKRLSFFVEQVKAAIVYYQKQGVLIRINGEQPIEAVTQEIFNQLENYPPPPENPSTRLRAGSCGLAAGLPAVGRDEGKGGCPEGRLRRPKGRKSYGG